MAFGAPFGGDATQFGGLPPEVLAALQQLQAQQQAAQADPQAPQAGPVAQGPGSPDALLYNRSPMGGGLNPFVAQNAGPATTGSVPDPNVPVAMTEADARQMERGMMPRDQGAPAPVPMPAPRVSGMNPDRAPAPGVPGVPAQPSVTAASTGNPDNSNIQPVNSFDPLTGQPVSGNPKPMRAPGDGGPTEGAGRVAAAAGNAASAGQSPNLLEKFAKGLNNPEVGNLLLNVGIGLMSQRGFGPGVAAGLQGYQTNQANGTKQALQQFQLMQQIQGQQNVRAMLKAKGVAPEVIEAAATNPAVLSNTLAQQSKDPQQFTVGGNVFLGRPDQDPSTWKNLGPSAGPPSGFQPTPNGLAPITGGPQDPSYQATVAKAKDDAVADKPQYVHRKDEDGVDHVYLVDKDTGALSTPPGVEDGQRSMKNPFAGTGKQTGDQAKAAGFSDRMFGSEPIMRKFEGLNSSGIQATIAEHLPNGMKSTERQQMEQAQRDFINAQLRRESGAAISEGEFGNARQQYFPQPGDAAEVIAQKRANRQSVITAMAREGGQNYTPPAIFGQNGEIIRYKPPGQRQEQQQPAAPQSQTPFSREDMLAEAKRRGLIK